MFSVFIDVSSFFQFLSFCSDVWFLNVRFVFVLFVLWITLSDYMSQCDWCFSCLPTVAVLKLENIILKWDMYCVTPTRRLLTGGGIFGLSSASLNETEQCIVSITKFRRSVFDFYKGAWAGNVTWWCVTATFQIVMTIDNSTAVHSSSAYIIIQRVRLHRRAGVSMDGQIGTYRSEGFLACHQ